MVWHTNLMIKRHAQEKLNQLSKGFPIISIVGPRQAGKSTLAKATFPNHTYISLENPSALTRALDDPIGFLKQYPQGLIIGEAQKAPELFSYLQEIVDTNKIMGQFILTGSQNVLLFSKISQSLAGRVGILHLLPFSFSELPNKNISLMTLMWQGLYPPIYDRKLEPTDWYPSYIQTYIERDVRQSLHIQDLHAFQRFLHICAGRVGQLMNIQKPEDIHTHFAKGPLFENFVISELYKSFSNMGIRPPFSFFRDHSGHEIDLLIEKGNSLSAIEIKAGLTITKDAFKHLLYFQNLLKDNAQTLQVIYAGDESYTWSKIAVTPWNLLSEQAEYPLPQSPYPLA